LNIKTGISQGYLSGLEPGRRTGTPESIAKLAQALNVPADWLYQTSATPRHDPAINAIGKKPLTTSPALP
jgi:transcriptional regulator with XRE-family HTH domain